MSNIIGGMFNFSDKLQMESLNQRTRRSEVITANIANAETPGYRAFGYDFEKQLQSISSTDAMPMKVSDPRHIRDAYTKVDGSITPDVFVKPTESVDEDGNTVNMDGEMAQLAQNQILFRTAVETLNRKIGT